MAVFAHPLSWLILSFSFQIYCVATETNQFTPLNNTLAKHNESCETDNDCDSSLQLKCTNGVCLCSHVDTMIFRNETGMCHLKWGQKCSHTENTLTSVQLNLPLCVPNSRCNPDGYCQCNNGTFEATNGACTPKLGFFNWCASTSQCQEDRGLSCISFLVGFPICDCNWNDSLTYSLKENRCVLLAGRKPTTHVSELKCVSNAHYNYSTGKCECNSGFDEKYGFCIVPFGGICDDYDQLCDPEMRCSYGRCECSFSGKDRVNGTCYSKASQPCLLDKKLVSMTYWKVPDFQNITLPCTANAICSLSLSGYTQRECVCQSDYVDVGGKCQKDNGERGLVGAVCVRTKRRDLRASCTPGAYCSLPSRVYMEGRNQTAGIPLKLEGRCRCMLEENVRDDRTCINNYINGSLTSTERS